MSKRGGFPGMGGFGGMNINQLMKEAKKMQADMEKTQEELQAKEFESTAGGGAVSVKVSGSKQILELKLNKDVVDPDDVEMLQDLNNTKHQVITSICVISEKNGEYKEQLDYDIADVYFKKMTDEEIEAWVDKDKPYDKAGGYAAQSAFGVHIEKTEGNFFTIMGLPIHKLYDMLKNI